MDKTYLYRITYNNGNFTLVKLTEIEANRIKLNRSNLKSIERVN